MPEPAPTVAAAGPGPGQDRDRGLDRRYLVAVLALLSLALAVRVGYVAATSGYRPTHDDRSYDVLATGIAHTGVYPRLATGPTAYRPPGYPYVLGALYAVTGTGPGRIAAGRLAQAAVGTVIVGLLGAVAARIFGRRAALATMTIAALYPPLFSVGTSLLSEPQSVALELGATLAVLAWRQRPRWSIAVLAGVVGGLLTLTRSNAFVVIPAMAVGMWIRPGALPGRPAARSGLVRRAAPAGVMVVVAVAVVAPWTVRNAVVVHSFIPVSDEVGGTLAGTYNPVSDHDRRAPAYWHLLDQIPSYSRETAALARGPEAEFQSRLLHLAEEYALHHPAYPLKVAWYNTLRLVGIESLSASRYTAGLGGVTVSWVADSCVFAFWAVAAVALATALTPGLRRRVPGFVWLEMLLLYLTIALVNSETPRLRLPLDPFLVVLAGAGLAAVTSRPGRPAVISRPGRAAPPPDPGTA